MKVYGSVDLDSTIEAINNQNNIYKTDPMFEYMGYNGLVPIQKSKDGNTYMKVFYSGPVVINYAHNGKCVKVAVPAQIIGCNYKDTIRNLLLIYNESKVLDFNNLVL